jgi:ABC-type sugar transport system ATPase subunit
MDEPTSAITDKEVNIMWWRTDKLLNLGENNG